MPSSQLQVRYHDITDVGNCGGEQERVTNPIKDIPEILNTHVCSYNQFCTACSIHAENEAKTVVILLKRLFVPLHFLAR